MKLNNFDIYDINGAPVFICKTSGSHIIVTNLHTKELEGTYSSLEACMHWLNATKATYIGNLKPHLNRLGERLYEAV